MKRLARMLALDLRSIVRDPLLFVFPFVPFLAAFALRFAVPAAARLLAEYARFDLAPFRPLIASVTLLLPGSMLGTAAGFIMLEERDEGIGAYRSATPGGKIGYLTTRLLPPTIAAWLIGIAVVYLGGFSGEFAAEGSSALVRAVLLSLPAALSAPFYALCLSAFSANKIEGLAFSKAMSILDFAPIAVAAPPAFRSLGMALPPFWIAEAIAGPTGFLPSLLIAIAFHLAVVGAMTAVFVRRMD